MKPLKSLVWRFFEKIVKDNKCVAVVCQLCTTEYKYFGNTTNLKTHLVNKHPIQWDLVQDSSIDHSDLRLERNRSISKKRKHGPSYQDKGVRYSLTIDKTNDIEKDGVNSMPEIRIERINVIDTSLLEEDTNETVTLVRQINDEGEEEWLEEPDPIEDNYEPPSQRKVKLKTVKREVVTPPRRISTYNLPSNAYKQLKVTKKEDEWSIFGEYIANKMRKFSNHRTQSNIQQLISTLMWQAEQGQYHNQENVKKLLLYIFQREPVTEAQIDQSNETNS